MKPHLRKHLCRALVLSYLLGSYNGFVALWKSEDPEPIYRFPIQVDSLPVSDQVLLRKGIALPDLDAALRAVEDYG